MFNFFKRSKQEKLPQLSDLDDNTLSAGDIVEVLRYELGRSKLILVDNTYYYQSLSSGEQVSWLKMIDASNDRQKVRKVSES